MPKISALPPMTTADAADEAPIVDTSASATKKWTLTLLKTYLQSLTSWLTTAMLTNASVTADKLATGASTAAVATSQTTTSSSYADLGTVGPTVTATIGANGLALVVVHGWTTGTIATANQFIGFAISGATTVAASDQFAAEHRISDTATGYNNQLSATFLVTGLTPGSNTFTSKYKTNAGTATFFDRKITVIPL